jgi:hypothetical protein
VLKKYDAVDAELKSPEGKAASCAGRMLNVDCRMKSKEQVFACIKIDESKSEAIVFFKRILKVNI